MITKTLLELHREKAQIEKDCARRHKQIVDSYIQTLQTRVSLPEDYSLNWNDRGEHIHVDLTTENISFRELYGIRNGRNSKDHLKGETFLVLHSWKTNKKTKGTHYLLLNRNRDRVAEAYF